ncbi:MAG: 1,4-dihydroxy-2-naphthoate polyprenyltransferase [Flammeovirgaceae bacterium]|nr:1,4-dihydroxy-2-naphthoate polyprenyltransferase [Flammeovirgaceae bacterium]
MNIANWIKAFRLRTLPLSLSSIGMGSFLAAYRNMFQIDVFWWSVLTTLFLQILSNLANDYGDTIHGADSHERQGPKRMVQSGQISANAMKTAIILFASLSFLAGVTLLWIALDTLKDFLLFLGLGILAIVAAIAYTNGKKPYGYLGLGDLAVLLFFGWTAVLGTVYLHTHQLFWTDILPATTSGVFAVAVLNINNMRDIESDRKAGKFSLPVRIGQKKAAIYHLVLLLIGISCISVYTLLHHRAFLQWIFLLTLPLLYKNAKAVLTVSSPHLLDPYLKQMAITTLLFTLLFGVGLVFSFHSFSYL